MGELRDRCAGLRCGAPGDMALLEWMAAFRPFRLVPAQRTSLEAGKSVWPGTRVLNPDRPPGIISRGCPTSRNPARAVQYKKASDRKDVIDATKVCSPKWGVVRPLSQGGRVAAGWRAATRRQDGRDMRDWRRRLWASRPSCQSPDDRCR
jgi:hypothetical protein